MEYQYYKFKSIYEDYLNNRKIDEAHPIISSKLDDGSRVEVQIPPIAANGGSCITIRKFNDLPLLLEMLIESGQMDYKMAYFLVKLSKGKCNIIVSGGTSSGKTTFLNAMTRFVDENEQLMVIEDTKEVIKNTEKQGLIIKVLQKEKEK